MERLDQRQGFLVSAVVHLMILTILSSTPFRNPAQDPVADESARPQVRNRLFLPPPEVLREMLPKPAPPPKPAATPAPPPPSSDAKDRISIGAPSRLRAQGPLILRRDDDLTKVQKGSPDAVPTPAAPPAPTPTQARRANAGETGQGKDRGANAERSDGFRLPELARPGPAETGGPRELEGPSIAESLRNLDDRLRTVGPAGSPAGTGRQMGPLFFDPRGADFTSWVNQFKDEVYRNWIVPQAALMGFGGHVDLEFSVEHDGRMTGLRMLKSSGTPSLDRAARNALLSSRFQPLPSDYGPPRVTMQVTFFYNEAPQGS